MPPSSRFARPLLAAILIGASGCDSTAPPLRHPGINAGLYPTGGGQFDTRLAGCVFEFVAADPEGVWDVSYVAEYDALGRRTRSAYREGPIAWYDYNVAWDAGSCPTRVWGDYADDVGMLMDLEYTNTCDALGNIIESTTPWGTTLYEHRYDASWGILQTVETSEEYGYESTTELHYVWAFGRMVAMTSGQPGGGRRVRGGPHLRRRRLRANLRGYVGGRGNLDLRRAGPRDHRVGGRDVRVRGYRRVSNPWMVLR